MDRDDHRAEALNELGRANALLDVPGEGDRATARAVIALTHAVLALAYVGRSTTGPLWPSWFSEHE